ncbi:Gfo/Idh/MocA family protein [Nonomuraea dietziae]|uniref:Gfo/Idh/MocA family protein n=1 Tax=Nonomuraea dietziae TaxID=65515 RepID=UPI0033C6217A
MSVRVGIVGPGGIAGRHADALAEAGAVLAAVAGPDREQATAFAEAHATPGHGPPAVHTTAGDLFAHPGLDAVVIASPHAHHAAQAEAALRAGLHTLCEIPVALSLGEAESLARTAARTGRRLAVAHTLRHCAPYLAVRELVEAGELRVTHVVARTLMLRQRDLGMEGRPRDWTDDVLWHHGAHTVDAALWFLGAESARERGGDASGAVVVRGARGEPWQGSGKPMDVAAVLRAPGGGLATIALSYHSRLAVRDLTIIAEDRTLHLSGGALRDHDGVLVDRGDGDRMEREGLARQDRDFVTAITRGRRPACTVDDVLPAMRVLDGLARSAP